MKKYSLKQGLLKAGKYLLFYGFPALIGWYLNANPAVSSLTVGTLLTGIVNYLKIRNK